MSYLLQHVPERHELLFQLRVIAAYSLAKVYYRLISSGVFPMFIWFCTYIADDFLTKCLNEYCLILQRELSTAITALEAAVEGPPVCTNHLTC